MRICGNYGGYNNMFTFRIIDMENGIQIIDTHLQTPYNSLTPVQMLEYMEVDTQMAIMDRIKKKERRAAEHRRRIARNPFLKLAYFCGLI